MANKRDWEKCLICKNKNHDIRPSTNRKREKNKKYFRCCDVLHYNDYKAISFEDSVDMSRLLSYSHFLKKLKMKSFW